MTRRQALKLLGGSAVAGAAGQGRAQEFAIAKGPFAATRESLRGYQTPEWFRDAKFGIWAHWGPQSAPEYGDWYARNMYRQASKQYKYHVAHYGHPSKFGFKDVIATWKGDRFDADHLIGLYKKAGAKYFVSMGVHHDNFDMWNSKHTRWNAAQMGTKRDIVGLFRKAARREGLRFGVSEHLWIAYKWFAVSHGADKSGPLAGVAYDGVDPKYADLYNNVAPELVTDTLTWNDDGIPESWKQHWFDRIKDLVDQHEPDLLYTDGALPFEQYGLNLVAHHYNLSAKRHGGRVEAIYNSKRPEDCEAGTCVLDVERGVVDRIWPKPWQTDTCIGHWHYDKEAKYKTPKSVVDMLVDIVSRNGNLLLNFPLPNSGELDAAELQVLEGITRWMAVNSEGIYGTRPWKIFGEGPAAEPAAAEAKFNEQKRKELTSGDVRFTTKGPALYAFVMGRPEKEAVIRALGQHAGAGKIERVEMLGHTEGLKWRQAPEGLRVETPAGPAPEFAMTLKIVGA